MRTSKTDEVHYFIGDLHYGQNNVHITIRPEFDSAREHDNLIHRNILAVGDKTKVLWLTGDTFLSSASFWRLEAYRLKYQTVNIILGNHCHKGLAKYATSLKGVNVFGGIKRFGFWITHLTVNSIDLERGPNIHAHNHNRVCMIDQNSQLDKRYFCTSAEAINYTPISLGEIKRRMAL